VVGAVLGYLDEGVQPCLISIFDRGAGMLRNCVWLSWVIWVICMLCLAAKKTDVNIEVCVCYVWLARKCKKMRENKLGIKFFFFFFFRK
jgi:hypothetical protein